LEPFTVVDKAVIITVVSITISRVRAFEVVISSLCKL
jgi:hypothetical protein